MELNDTKLVSIKDTSDARWLTVKGINTIHKIGLGQDGSLRSHLIYKDDSDDSSDEDGREDNICVDLFKISVCDTGGVMIAPINKDLQCLINGEDLISEMNLISGSIVTIADKKLKIVDGPPYKERKKLPPTPGVILQVEPPPKPHRYNLDAEIYVQPLSPSSDDFSDWYLVHSPLIDPEIIQSLDTPAKLGNMAASFLSRQIHLYTDSRLSASATDEIFKFLQNVAIHQRNLLLNYLTEMSKNYEELPEAERDRPVHSPAINLLVDILRQILDPLSHVVLCLQMIRTFSHFPKNLPELVHCRATPAILGCMAVYKDVREVQEYCLDILAKIATYKNQLQEKIPIRETGVEMILRTLKHHRSNADIVQPGCRTLTRLTTTIEEMLDELLNKDYQFCSEVEEAVEQYEVILKHVFEQAIPVVQDALQQFPKNLGVSKEGRHFLYNSTKMSLLMTKKKSRLLKSFSGNSKDPSVEDKVLKAESEVIYMPMANTFTRAESNDYTKGILKKTKSFEIVGDSHFEDRRVRFVDDDNPDSYTSSDANSSDSDGERNIQPFLEIQETKILQNMDHLSVPRSSHSHSFNDSFESTFKENKDFLLSVDGPECSIDDWFSSFHSNETCNKSPGFEYEIMNSSLEESVLLESSHKCVENHYETVDFLTCRDDSNSLHPQTELVKQSDAEIKNDKSDFSSHENVFTTDTPDDKLSDGNKPSGGHSSYSNSWGDNQCAIADVMFLTKVINAQAVQYISSLVIDGENARALEEIDQPIIDLLESSNAPSALLHFVNRELQAGKTMMDLEPTLVIQIIDAVHYRSVLHSLLQSTLLDVISCLQDVKDHNVLSLAMSCIMSIFTRDNLQDVIMDDEFLTKVKGYIESCMDKLQDIPETSLLTQKLYRDDMISSNLIKLSL